MLQIGKIYLQNADGQTRLCAAGEMYHPVSIQAPLTSERLRNKRGVGTGFSGGMDSLYSVMTHGAENLKTKED